MNLAILAAETAPTDTAKGAIGALCVFVVLALALYFGVRR